MTVSRSSVLRMIGSRRLARSDNWMRDMRTAVLRLPAYRVKGPR